MNRIILILCALAISLTPDCQKKSSAYGELSIQTRNLSARVIIIDHAGRNVFDGHPSSLPIPLPAGFYQLKATCPEYLDKNVDIVLRPRETTVLNLHLTPTFGTIQLQTSPKHARIEVADTNGRVVYDAQPDQNGLRLPAGSYMALITAEGFLEESRQFHLNPGDREFISVDLMPARGSLTARTPFPVQMTLIQEGIKDPISLPTGDYVHLELTPAQYRLELTEPGHHPVSKSFEIYAGRLTDLGLISPKPLTSGRLLIRSQPSDAVVYRVISTSDPLILGTTPLDLELEAGTYQLILEKKSVCTTRQHREIRIRAGKSTSLDVSLPSRSLIIESTPTGAEISLDNRIIGRTPLSICQYRAGRFRMIARKGIMACATTIELEPSKDNIFHLNLAPIFQPDGFIRIPGGEFIMGSDSGSFEERPAHTVYLDDYWITRHEITVAQYRPCVLAGACNPPLEGNYCNWNIRGMDQHPINCLSWSDARNYARWLGLEHGVVYRLPTEAEWEKAARGHSGNIYPWGSQWKPKANYCDQSCPFEEWKDNKSDGFEATSPVGSFPEGASPFGIEDMAGNVAEWVLDTYSKNYYKIAPTKNPVNHHTARNKVIRGGSWDLFPQRLTTTFRYQSAQNDRSDSVGFRLVFPLEENLPACPPD